MFDTGQELECSKAFQEKAAGPVSQADYLVALRDKATHQSTFVQKWARAGTLARSHQARDVLRVSASALQRIYIEAFTTARTGGEAYDPAPAALASWALHTHCSHVWATLLGVAHWQQLEQTQQEVKTP